MEAVADFWRFCVKESLLLVVWNISQFGSKRLCDEMCCRLFFDWDMIVSSSLVDRNDSVDEDLEDDWNQFFPDFEDDNKHMSVIALFTERLLSAWDRDLVFNLLLWNLLTFVVRNCFLFDFLFAFNLSSNSEEELLFGETAAATAGQEGFRRILGALSLSDLWTGSILNSSKEWVGDWSNFFFRLTSKKFLGLDWSSIETKFLSYFRDSFDSFWSEKY